MAALGESTWRGLDNPIRIAIEAKSLKCLQRGDTAASLQLFLAAQGRVALSVTTQGSHRSGRAHISASGSSADRFAIQDGPRGYPIE